MKRVNTASSTSQAHIRRMRREANQNVEVANLSQFEVERDINSICEPGDFFNNFFIKTEFNVIHFLVLHLLSISRLH
jgi:hypothetical protein